MTPALAAQRARLTHWFATPLAGKKIVWVGDSTTEKMGPASMAGWAGVNDYFLSTYVTPAAGRLAGTVQVWQGANGASLAYLLSSNLLADAIAAGGDVYVFDYGINDVRLGSTDQATLTTNLKAAVNAIRAGVPNADIVLRMPNSLLSADPTNTGFVQPLSAAQAYSDTLRGAYRALQNEWSNVVVYDSQALLYGETAPASSPYMADPLHPNDVGYKRTFDQVVDIIGAELPPACH